MFLSIIIPVYNGSKYLEETIRSVLQQPCDDYELILLDDGSQDNSLSICQRYGKIAPPDAKLLSKVMRIWEFPKLVIKA